MQRGYWTRYHGSNQGVGMRLETEGDYCKAPRPPTLSELMTNNDFVDEMTCSICLEILVDATALVPCGHVFCEGCLRKLRVDYQNRRECPNCKARTAHGQAFVPALVVRNMIARMELRCRHGVSFNTQTSLFEEAPPIITNVGREELPFGARQEQRKKKKRKQEASPSLPVATEDEEESVCRAVLKVASREAHERRCTFAPRACKWRSRGCRFVDMRLSADRHEATCDYRTDCCCWCSVEVPARNLEQHIKLYCPKKSIPCVNAKHGCAVVPQRESMEVHLRDQCTFEKLRPFFESKDARILQLEKQVENLMNQVSASDSSTLTRARRQSLSVADVPESSKAEPKEEEKLSQIFIACSSKKLLSVLIFLSNDTPQCLYDKIARAWHMNDPSQYHFSVRRQILDPTRTFASQGVERDSTLYVLPNMK